MERIRKILIIISVVILVAPFVVGAIRYGRDEYANYMVWNCSPYSQPNSEWRSDDGAIYLQMVEGELELRGTLTVGEDVFDLVFRIMLEPSEYKTVELRCENGQKFDPVKFSISGEMEYPATEVCKITVIGTNKCDYYQEGDVILLRKVA